MQFKEVKTKDEFIATLPVMKQDEGDEMNDDKVVANFLEAISHGYRHFAAYEGEDVIAVAGMTKQYNPNYSPPGYEVTNVVVDEKRRGQGIGTKMLEFCKQEALRDGVTWLRLGAYPQNYKVLAFYEKNGFKHTANIMFHRMQGSVG